MCLAPILRPNLLRGLFIDAIHYQNCLFHHLQDVGLTAGSQLRIIEASKKILAGYNRKDTTLIVGAFEGAGLKTIFIPKSVTKLSAGVFHGCPIEEVTFEKGSVLSKFEGVFSNEFRKGNYFGVFSDLTKLKKIVIPESVTVFGDCVFKGCSSLESVVFEGKSSIQTLPGIEYQNNVDEKTIGGIFADCSSLEYISLPASIHTVGDGTFQYCVNSRMVLSLNILGVMIREKQLARLINV